ncbi:MAG: hypothetical protein JXA35_05915 [Deltaproteobacteria bacterium]|nr:hypothetical protein [Deltaproteobacteria bacterium]
MKKLLFLLAGIGFLMSGCGELARQSEFWEHDTAYRNFDHLGFSWCGYKKPTAETQIKSQEQQWWGIPVEWIPEK